MQTKKLNVIVKSTRLHYRSKFPFWENSHILLYSIGVSLTCIWEVSCCRANQLHTRSRECHNEIKVMVTKSCRKPNERHIYIMCIKMCVSYLLIINIIYKNDSQNHVIKVNCAFSRILNIKSNKTIIRLVFVYYLTILTYPQYYQ